MEKKNASAGTAFIVIITIAVIIILVICLLVKVPEIDTSNDVVEKATRAAHDEALKSNWATVAKCLFVGTVGFSLAYIVNKVANN